MQTRLALLLLRGTSVEAEVPVDHVDEQRIEDALNWYREHLSQSPRVEGAAKAIGISAGHLRRIFKKNRGCSPQIAFMEIRLGHARSLLRTTSDDVSDVAPQCGFNHLSDFCRVFKIHMGTSPYKWRIQAVTK